MRPTTTPGGYRDAVHDIRMVLRMLDEPDLPHGERDELVRASSPWRSCRSD